MTTPTAAHLTARFEAGAGEVLASLPQSYVVAASADGAIAVLEGAEGWPAAALAALDSGAVGVIVIHPSPADVVDLRARRAVVVLDSRWASNPVVPAAAEAFRRGLPESDRVECRTRLAVGSDLAGALLDQLTLIRALLGPVTDVRLLTHGPYGFAAEGVTEGHPIDLEVVCTDAVPTSASVRLLTADGGVDLHIPSGDTAEPARLVVTTPDGALQAPTLYETGHRATWRRVRSLLAGPAVTSPPTDVVDLAFDRSTVLTAFPHDEG